MPRKNASHPMKIGAAVTVFAVGPFGQPYCEGHAVVVATCRTAHHYHVRFLRERITRTRFVSPDFQKNPNRSLTLLREFLRTGSSSNLDDFFPDPQGQ